VSLAFRQIKVYIKSALVLIVVLAVGVILFKNRTNTARFWFFGLVDAGRDISVLWLVLCTAAGSIVSWSVFWMALGLIKDTRELARQRELGQREESQRQLAARLAEQEQRIDRKIGQVIRSDAESDSHNT